MICLLWTRMDPICECLRRPLIGMPGKRTSLNFYLTLQRNNAKSATTTSKPLVTPPPPPLGRLHISFPSRSATISHVDYTVSAGKPAIAVSNIQSSLE